MRGQRLTELLKQNLASPYDVTDQIVSVYAGTSGVLDEIPNDKVGAFEKVLLNHLREKYPDVIESINSAKAISEDNFGKLDKAMKEALEAFGNQS